jgi:hypothetical protein
MNLPVWIFLAATLWLGGLAFADVAKVAALGKEESLVVDVHYEGAVPQVTHFTFTPGKVVVTENGKNFGEVALTPGEQAQVDRYLDLVRNGRYGRGNGASTYVIRLMKDGKERKSAGETHRIRLLEKSEAKVLSLDELKRRAAK